MIAIRANANDADISGTAPELESIRLRVLRLINSADHFFQVAAAIRAHPDPYERVLRWLRVVRGSGPSRVQINGESLVVTGSDDNLARFASWFTFSPEAGPGEHGHYEHLEGDPYVAVDSVPLVVGITRGEL